MIIIGSGLVPTLNPLKKGSSQSGRGRGTFWERQNAIKQTICIRTYEYTHTCTRIGHRWARGVRYTWRVWENTWKCKYFNYFGTLFWGSKYGLITYKWACMYYVIFRSLKRMGCSFKIIRIKKYPPPSAELAVFFSCPLLYFGVLLFVHFEQNKHKSNR